MEEEEDDLFSSSSSPSFSSTTRSVNSDIASEDEEDDSSSDNYAISNFLSTAAANSSVKNKNNPSVGNSNEDFVMASSLQSANQPLMSGPTVIGGGIPKLTTKKASKKKMKSEEGSMAVAVAKAVAVVANKNSDSIQPPPPPTKKKKIMKKKPPLFPAQLFDMSAPNIWISSILINKRTDRNGLDSIYVAFSAASYAVLRALLRANKREDTITEEEDLNLDAILQTAILQEKHAVVTSTNTPLQPPKREQEVDMDNSSTETDTSIQQQKKKKQQTASFLELPPSSKRLKTSVSLSSIGSNASGFPNNNNVTYMAQKFSTGMVDRSTKKSTPGDDGGSTSGSSSSGSEDVPLSALSTTKRITITTSMTSTGIVKKRRSRGRLDDSSLGQNKYVSIEQEEDTSPDATATNVDPRTVMTRAILCSVATIVFSNCTPPPIITNPTAADTTNNNDNTSSSLSLNPLDIPQKNIPKLNLGAVLLQSTSLGKRILSNIAFTSVLKHSNRYQFIRDGLASAAGGQQQQRHNNSSSPTSTILSATTLAIPNPFLWNDKEDKLQGTIPSRKDALVTTTSSTSSPVDPFSLLSIQHLQNDRIVTKIQHEFQKESNSLWNTICKPRFLQILNYHPSPSLIHGENGKDPTNFANTSSSSCATTSCDRNGGHVIYHDVDWTGRTHRIADILYTMASTHDNFGPHLILCTSDQVPAWEMSFAGLGCFSLPSLSSTILRALSYTGTKRQRHNVLPYLYATAVGSSSSSCSFVETSTYLPNAPYHVVITSYKIFLQDFVPLCQIPWQIVILDDGMSWLGTAHFDPNGKIGRSWDAIFSKSDGWAGLAGVPPYFGGRGDLWSSFFATTPSLIPFTSTNISTEEDEEQEDADEEGETESLVVSEANDSDSATEGGGASKPLTMRKSSKNSSSTKCSKALLGTNYLLGLTARHRILTCSHLSAAFKGTLYPAPVPSLIQFLCPQYMDITREEWDRSRISSCVKSIRHIRSLVGRAVIVHPALQQDDANVNFDIAVNQVQLAWDAMEGMSLYSEVFDNGGDSLASSDLSLGHASTENLVMSGKITQSRRFATAWLSSSMRQELACSLDHILGAVNHSSASAGYVCEEIVSSGASGSAGGGNLYGCAVRCGRIFTNEQGLRQHLAAMHAPPGTWLCRSCGADCGTSLARTYHERYCAAAAGSGGTSGATPTVGQGISNLKQHGPGIGKQGSTGGSVNQSAEETVDKDGALLVPTFRGVWINADGKYFVKIDGKAISQEHTSEEESASIAFFVSAEEAAHHYDDAMKRNSDEANVELNFKEDGSRNIYEDTGTMSNVSRSLDALGGGAISVVPALSVINIKDLPENVKPLLRDPRQASRAGANSKRFIYKYRGVCRQARKGHDRWQSQISFGGTNHYLGTFDSEWDAAAIYAWAHLILYGEEATKKAEKEGEEAVAIWEQEQKDIAEGKIVVADKSNKKVQPMVKKAGTGIKAELKSKMPGRKTPVKKDTNKAMTKRKTASPRVSAENGACFMLLGLNAIEFGWSPDFFISMCAGSIGNLTAAITSLLKVQFGDSGENTSFKEMLKILPVMLGARGGGKQKGTFIDCDVRGPIRTCSTLAAKIEYASPAEGFQLSCCNEDDIVTLNAHRITNRMGPIPIKPGDVCSVGARVFLFLLPNS